MIQLNEINDSWHACTYKFANPKAATTMARHAQSIGCDDISVVRSGDLHKLSFKGSWQKEKELISKAPLDYGNFRMGSHYSKGESDLISEMFFCWHIPDDIERAIRRDRSAISALLEKLNFLPCFPRHSFKSETAIDSEGDEYNTFFKFWEAGFLKNEGFSRDLVEEMERLEVIPSCLRTYNVRDARLDEDSYAEGVVCFYPFDRIVQDELFNILSYLTDLGKWYDASNLCEEAGEIILDLRCRRRMYTDPLNFLALLEKIDKLPWDLLYQRELLRAYKNHKFATIYQEKLIRWIEAARERKTRPYAKNRIRFPGSAPFPVELHDDPIAAPLYFGESEENLIRLAMQGNRLAAAILGDTYRVRSQLSSRFEIDAERCEKIQDGYWPAVEELHALHVRAFPFDPQYAQMMRHVAEYDGRISFAW